MPTSSNISKTQSPEKSKYAELFDGIVARIQSCELKPGERIPSENELIAKFGVSNTTARRALLELKNRGWVRKVKGSGTFVSEIIPAARLVRQLGSFSAIRGDFSANLEREGYKPTVKIIEKKVLRGGVQVEVGGQSYEIADNALKIRFLRFANGLLLKDETKFVSLSLFPFAEHEEFFDTGTFVLKGDADLKITSVLRDISAAISTQIPDDNYFGNSEVALITLEGVCICQCGKIAEIETSLYRADKYKFFVSAQNAT